MPILPCVQCARMCAISTKSWRLILSGEPFICGPDCVRDWIYSHEADLKEYEGGKRIESNGPYRSDFELRFAYWLARIGVAFLFETWVFPVGGGYYIPDFYILERNLLVETKGAWALGAKSKYREFRMQYPTIPILLVPWAIQAKFK